ncbi:ribulose-phosphate 3-epimerase [Paenibacillaceae bacterium WGS1546]|uniref:ribulose-phosphate 3-epimerase n=1 Tax=Cohnella sp. WGS1546 TaxID=3366810 RepID=UPI00372D73EF
MEAKVALSIMCADPLNLGEALDEIRLSGAHYVHADVMDGTFVNNITLGFDQIGRIAETSAVPVEVHLMVGNLDIALNEVLLTACTHVSFHIEATSQPVKYLTQIRQAGKRAGIALNPHASPEFLANIAPYVDYVLVMTVEPGFAGQKFLEGSAPKIGRIRELIGPNKDIVVDGNIGSDTAAICRSYGANIFVLGTTAAYSDKHVDMDKLNRFRQAIGLKPD